MFGEFRGLPLHALVVHAAVMFAPLAAALGFGYVVPKWRGRLLFPLLAASVIAASTLVVARQSGLVLKTALGEQLNGNLAGALVARHQELGGQLLIAVLVLLVLSVVAAAVRLRGAAATSARKAVALVVPPGVLLVSIAVLVLTVQTGEAGAKARWNPDGSFSYSGK